MGGAGHLPTDCRQRTHDCHNSPDEKRPRREVEATTEALQPLPRKDIRQRSADRNGNPHQSQHIPREEANNARHRCAESLSDANFLRPSPHHKTCEADEPEEGDEKSETCPGSHEAAGLLLRLVGTCDLLIEEALFEECIGEDLRPGHSAIRADRKPHRERPEPLPRLHRRQDDRPETGPRTLRIV